MTTDITNLQILKAMYAAADAIIEAGYFVLKEPLTAAQIDKEIGKDKLVTDGLSYYDQSNWLKAGSYEGFTLTDEGLTVNITVGSFSCSMVYASLFRMIAKFEKLCGVPASKAKKFANKQEQERIAPVTDGSLLNNASNVASFAAVTDNIAFADNAPASVEEHTDTNDTNDTNDTEKIYLPVVSCALVPAVIAPAKEEKAEEHTDTMQPVIISLPVATVNMQPVEALNADYVELVDDDTNDTDTDTNTTANDQEHTDHLLRRIFALAAFYIAIVVMMVLAFGGNDNINANNIHTTAKDHTGRTTLLNQLFACLYIIYINVDVLFTAAKIICFCWITKYFWFFSKIIAKIFGSFK